MSYLFSKKIRCSRCLGGFRGLTERGRRKYICGRYHNYKTCIRYKVDEKALVDLVINHWEIMLIRNGIGLGGAKTGKKRVENVHSMIDIEKMIEYVRTVNVDPVEKKIEIFYQDDTNTLISKDRLTY